MTRTQLENNEVVQTSGLVIDLDDDSDGAMIVGVLREYRIPAYIYLPPHKLCGGSWVVGVWSLVGICYSKAQRNSAN